MNVAGIGEVKTAGGFNAFLYEPISTRLMDTFSMAVPTGIKFPAAQRLTPSSGCVKKFISYSGLCIHTCSTRVDAQDEECGHRLDQRRQHEIKGRGVRCAVYLPDRRQFFSSTIRSSESS